MSDFAKDKNVSINDCISRRTAIEAFYQYPNINWTTLDVMEKINELPSAQPDVPDRKVGEWDMFELITSVYFGKQYYFVEENGLVYNRETHKYMTKEDAISEFLSIIGE